ncbi:MAG: hypothetical protein M9951_01565 [Burkholderiaceae bacterium]|jgi:hypothetical protein|nr:hypothetical protein [Burkholderiaceae bacterium]MEB2318746.1 hypothetical protein [Pseudomonadota bacterium]
MVCIVALLVASSGLAASPPAHAADASQGARAFAGRTYEGVVSAHVKPPRGSGFRAVNRHGRGTAELQMTGKDTATLLLIGNVEKDNDASFAAEGRFVGADWRGGTEAMVTISGDGRIAGSGTVDGNQMDIRGRFEGRKLDVYVELRPLSATSGGFPAGTAFQFGYTLVDPVAIEPGSGDGDGCREIVYRTKLVPNLFGGTMSTVQVPECRR